jgi:hypothetical protein
LDHLFPSDLSLHTDDRLMRLLTPLLLFCTALSACAPLTPVAPKPPAKSQAAPVVASAGLGTDEALDTLARINTLSAEQQRAELARLDGERPPAAIAAQFRLALLLGRDDDPAAVERGLKLLGTIEADGSRAQAVLDLAKSALRAQLDARRNAARAQELQTRIDQIKALEKSLQQRDAAPKPR